MTRRRIACVGAAAVDRLHRATEPVVLGSATPATVSVSHGGVARNVAQHLAALGDDVVLVTALGDDADGAGVRDALERQGIGVVAARAQRTASYVAVLDEAGELVLAVVDMEATDVLDGDWAHGMLAALGDTDLVLADCNLGAPALAALLADARTAPWPLVVEATSVTCARRLPADLAGVDVLVANRRELAALTAADGPPEHLARLAVARGAASVVVLCGADGVVQADAGGLRRVPAPDVTVVEVTGAGDAFTAGFVHALAAGGTVDDALAAGRVQAGLALSGRGAVPG